MTGMRGWLQRLFALCFLVFGFAHAAPVADYVLGAGDTIRISVYQNPDLTLETRVSDAGTISYPLLGEVKLGGLSVSSAEKKLAAGLRDGNFLKQPQVSLLVLQVKSNQVSVLGQVNRPGRYPLESGSTKLSELLAQAGGIVPVGGSDIVVVAGKRDGKPFRKEIDFAQVFAAGGNAEDVVLENGDAIWVDRAPMIYIYGEVQRPGALRLERDMTVLQALAGAGGLTLRGTERGVRLNRRDASGQMQVLQPGLNDKLQANDIVYIKESLF